jgi:hypothetical protein
VEHLLLLEELSETRGTKVLVVERLITLSYLRVLLTMKNIFEEE